MNNTEKKSMVMSDKVWKRHASPWSVWTRFATLPFLVLAIWSRDWIGLWSLAPIGILVFWIWVNPRIFPIPKTTKAWASKATFGERVWLNRKKTPIPQHHLLAIRILVGLTSIGSFVAAYGLIVLNLSATIIGVLLVYMAKMWFLDRMVWLYEDVKNKNDEYRSWEY